MNRILPLITIALFSVSSAQAQDKLYKKTGEVLETKVLEIGSTEIKYKVFTNQSGPTYALPKSQLDKIVYENGETEIFKTTVQTLNTAAMKRAQNVFVEVGAQGLLFTANYDTRFTNSRKGLGGRVGIGALAIDGVSLVTVPVSLNYLLGEGKHFFEIGLGATYAKFSDDEEDTFFGSSDGIIGTMAFMYRLQPETSGFSFRGGFTPFFNKDGFIPYYGGISLGYTF